MEAFFNERASQAERAVVRAEFDQAELDRMRALLDNSELPRESRQNFLYALSNAGMLSGSEIDRYAAEIGADAEDVRSGGQAFEENVENARESLSTAHEDIWRAGANRVKADIERARSALAQGGFSTSDEIIDQARTVSRLFEDFYPRYERASDIVGGEAVHIPRQPVIPLDTVSFEDDEPTSRAATYSHTGIDPRSIRAGMDEFRGIEFSAFHTDAGMLVNAHDSVVEAKDALEGAWSADTADWTGGAKESAAQINDNLGKGADTLSNALRKAGEAVGHTMDNAIQPCVVNYAHQVLGIYGDGTIAQLTPHGVDELIRGVSWSLPSAMENNKKLYESFGLDTEEMVAEYEAAIKESKTKLAEFCSEYRAKAESVHGQGANFVSEIDQHYSTLLEFLSSELPPDLFAAQGTGDVGIGGSQPDGPGGVGTGGVGAGGVPAGVGGSGTGAGGGMPGAGGARMPGMDELKPDTGRASTNPVTGEALEIDPDTGEPYPIDPETGEAITDAAGQGTLTVEKGEQKFTISEPDDEGEMGISVEEGSGGLKDYRLDFGSDENPEGVAGGSEKVYRPGPDGKIHIADGDLKITAEQPEGLEGPTVVTVDNGDGEPATYTLGSGKQEDPPLREGHISTQSGRADAGDTGGGSAGTLEASANDESSSASMAGGDVSPGAGEARLADGTAEAGTGEVPAAESGAGGWDSAVTTPQAVDGGGGGMDSGGEPGTGSSSASSGAGLGTAPGGEAAGPMAQSNGSTSGGGMGMVGGMGGTDGVQSGDQERATNPYRVDGDIFEAVAAAARISGTLGEALDVPIRFSR